MLDSDVPAVAVEQLFANLFVDAENSLPETVTARFPDYLPPVVVGEEARQILGRAFRILRQAARAGYGMFVNALYEDHRNLRDCSVILSIQLQTKDAHHRLSIGEPWFVELSEATRELVRVFIPVAISAEQNAMTVDFRLPVHHHRAAGIHHPNTVLLVEDDDFVRNATRELLELEGYVVNAVGTAETALTFFERQGASICVVISDITLPGMDGRSFAKLLHKKRAELPVVLISGYLSQQEEHGEMVFVSKPFNAKTLLAALHRCLHEKHLLAASIPVSSPIPTALSLTE